MKFACLEHNPDGSRAGGLGGFKKKKEKLDISCFGYIALLLYPRIHPYICTVQGQGQGLGGNN